MDDDGLHGEHHLFDSLHSLEYSGADVVGKQAHQMYLESQSAHLVRFPDREHRFTDFVAGPTMVMPRSVALEHRFPDAQIGEDTELLRCVVEAGGRIYSADRFEFVQVRRGAGEHTWDASDAEMLANEGGLRPQAATELPPDQYNVGESPVSRSLMSASTRFEIVPASPVRSFQLAVTLGAGPRRPRGGVLVITAYDHEGKTVPRSEDGWPYSNKFDAPSLYVPLGERGTTVPVAPHHLEFFAVRILVEVKPFLDPEFHPHTVEILTFMDLEPAEGGSIATCHLASSPAVNLDEGAVAS